MKGASSMKITKETVIEALQGYFDQKVFSAECRPRVLELEPESRGESYVVTFSEPKPAEGQ